MRRIFLKYLSVILRFSSNRTQDPHRRFAATLVRLDLLPPHLQTRPPPFPPPPARASGVPRPSIHQHCSKLTSNASVLRSRCSSRASFRSFFTLLTIPTARKPLSLLNILGGVVSLPSVLGFVSGLANTGSFLNFNAGQVAGTELTQLLPRNMDATCISNLHRSLSN